ncbi:MAG TPA: excinuclease ABC subunit UvrC [Chthoniobacteraceae bacterium]|nr:excinuclease ABC subunit UvrC [Chthoniobacteraceae bacterium]
MKKVHELPHKPGVYLMRDRLARVIYVGKARDLRKRVGQYFMPSRKMTADIKTRALLDSIWDFEIHTVKSEPEALLLEGRLIKEYRPKYNISFRDDKRFLLVKVDEREEWPRFRLSRFKKDDGVRYFGPYANAGALRETIKFMRKKFGVLTFGRGAPTERELKYSSYQVPSRLSDINAEQYRERIAQACAFLAGQMPELVAQLETEMRAAADKLDFERAAELRGMVEDLRSTMKPVRRFTRHSLPSSIEPVADVNALGEELQLPRPPVVMECFDISNISTTHVVASMVCFRNGVPDRANYRRYRIKTVEGQNDFASMAEVVRRRYSRVLLETAERVRADDGGRRTEEKDNAVDYSPEFSQETTLDAARRIESPTFVRIPDLVIVDGGKGQLSSACKELQRLGLHDLPIIGLAKEFEEIYRPGTSVPLRLPHESGALRLLQRIRDEAHRFANGYHQLLMKRRIAESILDDCPGVSENRKQLLLKKFGSVARLRKATVDEIAATEGIGRKLAEQVAEFLKGR